MAKVLPSWAGIAALLLVYAGVAASAQQPPARTSAADQGGFADPNVLVRSVVQRELKAEGDDSHLYRYVLSRETGSGILVRDMLETKGLIVARTLAWNGKTLNERERAKDDERLKKLLSNEEEQEKKLQEQHSDQERVTRLLAALPNALIYTYDGRDIIEGRENIRLSFKPKPGFSAYKETYLYKAAEGYLWIDAKDLRLRRLVATLKDDVNIGWGILGHIDKGSHLEVDQQPVPGNGWRISRLIMEGTGRAFIFKTVKIHTIQHAYNFTPVPPMTLEVAIQLLQAQPLTVAEQH